MEYTGQMILLQAKTCQVCFEGSRLSIDYYTNEDMNERLYQLCEISVEMVQ